MPNPEYAVQNYKEMAVLVAEEGTYGTDAAPTDTDGLKIRDAQVSILGTELSEDVVNPVWGNDPMHYVGKFVEITGNSFLVGSGTAGDAPGIGTIIRCAGHEETIDVGVDVAYSPIQESIPSLTCYFYHGNDLWKITGCRTNFTMKANKLGWFDFGIRMVGMFAIPENNASAIPDPAFANWALPDAVEFDTTTATLHGQAMIMHDYNFDCGNQITPIDVPGQKEVRITDRLPTASIQIAAPALTVKDFYTIAQNRTQGALEIVLGATAGNIVTHNLPKCEVKMGGMETNDIDGDKGLTMQLNPLAVDPDPDYDLVFT